jgi:hypothetical protein
MTPPPSTHDGVAPETEGAFWHKSTYSGNDNGCVERGRLTSGRHAVRDTKDRARAMLFFEASAWEDFVTSVRRGDL